MTPTEAAALLTICAAYDNRKPDADAAKAWAAALDGYRFEDCRAAIVKHYRDSTDWVMPAHIAAEVRRVRGQRIAHENVAIPCGFDPDNTGAYARLLAEARRAQADGLEVAQPTPPEPLAIEGRVAELRAVVGSMPRMPRVTVAPREKSPEYDRRMEAARAELASREPIPIPGPLDDEPEGNEA